VEKAVGMLTYYGFNQKLENLKFYMLFYDNFLLAIVGQETFERNMNKYPEDKEYFGTPTDHAFAHLTLKTSQDQSKEKMKTKNTDHSSPCMMMRAK
jgi:hypothetical protein